MGPDIELRVRGTLLGVIVGGTALVVKKGRTLYEVDWARTLAQGAPVIFERVLHPEEDGVADITEQQCAVVPDGLRCAGGEPAAAPEQAGGGGQA